MQPIWKMLVKNGFIFPNFRGEQLYSSAFGPGDSQHKSTNTQKTYFCDCCYVFLELSCWCICEWSSKNQSWNEKSCILGIGRPTPWNKYWQTCPSICFFFRGFSYSICFFQERLFPPKKTTKPILSIPILVVSRSFSPSFSSNMGRGSIVTSLPIPAIIRFLQPPRVHYCFYVYIYMHYSIFLRNILSKFTIHCGMKFDPPQYMSHLFNDPCPMPHPVNLSLGPRALRCVWSTLVLSVGSSWAVQHTNPCTHLFLEEEGLRVGFAPWN